MLTIKEQIVIMDAMKPHVEAEGIIDVQYSYDMLKALIINRQAFCEMVDEVFISYFPFKELNGRMVMNELFIYIPKEKRGNIRLLLGVLKRFEILAREYDCEQIKIGSNYGVVDDKFTRFLIRKGYKTDTLYKNIEV